MSETIYRIHSVNGPVVTVTGGRGLAMMDMVNVGEERLIGEVVSVTGAATAAPGVHRGPHVPAAGARAAGQHL